MNETRCPSCSVAYIDHLGLNGTCGKLLVAMAALEDLAEDGFATAITALAEIEKMHK